MIENDFDQPGQYQPARTFLTIDDDVRTDGNFDPIFAKRELSWK